MPDLTWLFIGDSITDCGRTTDPQGLGTGYVRLLAATPELSGRTVVNRGVSGNRVRDLVPRWDVDAIAARPDVISILIGINDVWSQFGGGDPTDDASFTNDLATCLRQIPSQVHVILVEPFITLSGAVTRDWIPDLAGKRAAIRDLAGEYGCDFVPTYDRFLEPTTTPLTRDGVHPTPAGHQLLANLWLQAWQAPTTTAGSGDSTPLTAEDAQ